MKIKAVVLDIGGVIVRTEDPAGRQALQNQFDLPERGVERLVFDSKEAAASTVGHLDAWEVWDSVGKKLNLSASELDEFISKFWQGDVFDHTLFQYFQHLRSDYTTALLTNAWQGARTDLANRYGIIEGKSVDHLLISSELGVAKPDIAIYQILRQTVNQDFENILFVDDFIENILAANTLGIQTIHYQPSMNLVSEIQSALNK
jgi:HAD superfamily hydrolase (TIGR01509 family)